MSSSAANVSQSACYAWCFRRCSDWQVQVPSSRQNLEEGIKVEPRFYNIVGQDKDYHRWSVYCYGGSKEGTGYIWFEYMNNNLEEVLFELSGEQSWVRALFCPSWNPKVWDSVIISWLIGSVSYPGSFLESEWPEEHRVTLGYSCWNGLPSLDTCNRLQIWPRSSSYQEGIYPKLVWLSG